MLCAKKNPSFSESREVCYLGLIFSGDVGFESSRGFARLPSPSVCVCPYLRIMMWRRGGAKTNKATRRLRNIHNIIVWNHLFVHRNCLTTYPLICHWSPSASTAGGLTHMGLFGHWSLAKHMFLGFLRISTHGCSYHGQLYVLSCVPMTRTGTSNHTRTNSCGRRDTFLRTWPWHLSVEMACFLCWLKISSWENKPWSPYGGWPMTQSLPMWSMTVYAKLIIIVWIWLNVSPKLLIETHCWK